MPGRRSQRRINQRTPHRRARQPPIKQPIPNPNQSPPRPKRLPRDPRRGPKLFSVFRKHTRRPDIAESRIERRI